MVCRHPPCKSKNIRHYVNIWPNVTDSEKMTFSRPWQKPRRRMVWFGRNGKAVEVGADPTLSRSGAVKAVPSKESTTSQIREGTVKSDSTSPPCAITLSDRTASLSVTDSARTGVTIASSLPGWLSVQLSMVWRKLLRSVLFSWEWRWSPIPIPYRLHFCNL